MTSRHNKCSSVISHVIYNPSTVTDKTKMTHFNLADQVCFSHEKLQKFSPAVSLPVFNCLLPGKIKKNKGETCSCILE